MLRAVKGEEVTLETPSVTLSSFYSFYKAWCSLARSKSSGRRGAGNGSTAPLPFCLHLQVPAFHLLSPRQGSSWLRWRQLSDNFALLVVSVCWVAGSFASST